MDDRQQTAFSRRFGPREGAARSNAGGGAEIAAVFDVDPEPDTVPPTDDWRRMCDPDSGTGRLPAPASLPPGREVPPGEGETGFATGRAARNDMEEALKQEPEDPVAIPDVAGLRGLMRNDLVDEAQWGETQPVPWAAVRRNPAGGRHNNGVNDAGARASHIRGRDMKESRAFPRSPASRIAQERCACACACARSRRQGGLVMRDNRCRPHRGRSRNRAEYSRAVHRATAAGLGPVAA